jgi:glycosyltransferase involved in cell wall biosynthesis
MRQIGEALAKDERFDLYVSPSLQSEQPPEVPADRLLAVETFSGAVSLVWRTLTLPFAIGHLIRRMQTAKIGAIVTVMPHVWGLALQRAAKRAGIKTLLTIHDAEPHPGETRPLFDWLVGREIAGSDRIVTFSDHVADLLAARGVAESRLIRLFHPIFCFGAKDGAHPAKPFRLLFFGRILPYKGVPMLLDAFAKLRVAGVDATLTVVGRGDIDAQATLMNQPGLTIRTGWVAPDAIGGILAEADAIALPYLEASQSGVVAAAYGAGLPVIATPVGGLAEQVTDGETGTLASDATPAAFAEATRRLLETPGLYDACRQGAARYCEAHSAERLARALGDAVLATIGA